jgi:hypothetical protein
MFTLYIAKATSEAKARLIAPLIMPIIKRAEIHSENFRGVTKILERFLSHNSASTFIATSFWALQGIIHNSTPQIIALICCDALGARETM